MVRGRASGHRRIQVLLCFAHLSLRELRFLVTVLRLYSHTVIETLLDIVHTAARADLAENHFCDGSVASRAAVLVMAVKRQVQPFLWWQCSVRCSRSCDGSVASGVAVLVVAV